MAITLVLTPSPVTAGQMFTATATTVPANPNEPITFVYDAQPPQTVLTNAAGVATASFLATTTGPVVATGPTSGSANTLQTVNAAPNCVVTVTTTPANPTTGQPVTATATVTCNGVAVDGAVVAFSTPTNTVIQVTAGGVGASANLGPLPLGTTPVTATVIAFTGVPPTCLCIGVNSTVSVVVTQAPACLVTLTSSPANPTVGQPVTLTATVTCNGLPVSGATVAFAGPGTPLPASATTNAAGVATTTTTTPLPAGANTFTATVNSVGGTCTCTNVVATTVVTVTAAPTCTVTLTSSPANPTAGQPVTLTATVLCNGAPVVGATVNFAGPGTPLPASTTTNAAGVATTTTTTPLPAGANTFTATVNSVGGTCTCTNVVATTVVTVTAAPTCTVTLTSSPTNPTAGQSVALTATVLCGGAPVQNATVLFSSGNTILGSATTNAAGAALATTTALPAGNNTVTATVIGNGTTCSCVGTFVNATVTVGPSQAFTAQPACYTLNFPPLPWSFAHATLTATGATPGTTVTFHSDGPSGPILCTAVADTFGNASCTANLSIFQLLSGYTATTPVPGGFLTSHGTLLPCIIS
ncbi:Ig-like domain repeat protein [Streptomyces sioyaensis]|uniref:Ig-like domain repeat protein n=1 Tax=Streptomyces sioyaensis TaxID=67364 RepID=UPI0037D043F1